MGTGKQLAILPLFVRDYLAATRHFSLAERGAYTDLLFFAWDAGAPIPKDPARLATLLGCTPKMLASVWPAIRVKLIETEDGYISERLEIERRKALALRAKASEKAAIAAASRWGHAPSNARSNAPSTKSYGPRDASSIAQAMLGQCPPSSPPSPSPEKTPDSEASAARKRVRPAGPKGQRARTNGLVNEGDPEVQRRRREAAETAAQKSLHGGAS